MAVRNIYTGADTVIVGPDVYAVKADFNFVAALEKDYPDIAGLLQFFGSGKVSPLTIKRVLVAALKDINGKPIPDNELEAHAEHVATASGLMESWALCSMLLDYAFYGAEKKSLALCPKLIAAAEMRLRGLASIDTWKRPYLWTWVALNFGGSVCTALLVLGTLG